MKNRLFVLLFFLNFNTFFAQNAIQFIENNWAEAFQKARTEKKIVFIDAYTTWCGPCKMMVRKTFSDPAVAQFFNENFVSLKLDMEAGDGPSVGSKYGVQGYPTLLFIDGAGRLHRGVGFHEPAEFLALGKDALDQTARLSNWAIRYANGEKSPEFLKAYALKLVETFDENAQKVAEQYLATQQNWGAKENLSFVFRFSDESNSPVFSYFVRNKTKFYTDFGKENVETKIQNTATDKLMNEKNPPRLDEADSLINLVFPERAARFSSNYRMIFYRMKGDKGAYAEAAVRYFKEYADNADELAETAQTFVDVIEDEKMLKNAVKWAKKANSLDPSVPNMTILAKVYQKIGKTSRARKTIQKAIKLGKESGEPIAEAEEMLKELM